MNKIIKILLLIIGLIIVFFCLTEFSAKQIIEAKYGDLIKRNNETIKATTGEKGTIKISYYRMQKRNFKADKIPKVTNGSSKSLPILFFGCGFLEGVGLKPEQTLPYKFTEFTGITTYSYPIGGGGPQHMLYMLKRDDTTYRKVFLPDNQMVIYLFEQNHYKRILTSVSDAYSSTIEPQYKLKKGKLVLVKPKFLWLHSLYTYRLVDDIIRNFPISQEHNYDLFYAILKESYNVVKQKFPDAKFVILLYQNYPCDREECVMTDQIEELEEVGFRVFNLSELVGHDLFAAEGYSLVDNHPNEKAWDEIVPVLIKKLNLPRK